MFTPFFGGDDRIAVEVGGALLELREVLDGLERALRTEEPLDVHAAQRRRIDPVAELLWSDVADEVRGAVGVAVRVAVEARHAAARAFGTAILGLVELLLRKRRQEQAQPFDLLRVQDAVE